jgi:hypothetical protein
MENIVIDSEAVSEVKVGGDWYSIKHGTLHVGPMSWANIGGDPIDSGELGFRFEIYGSQSMVVAGPLAAINGVRYTKPL